MKSINQRIRLGTIVLTMLGIGLLVFANTEAVVDEKEDKAKEESEIRQNLVLPAEPGIPEAELQKPRTPKYAPGEVLVGLKEGAKLEDVLKDVTIHPESFGRIHNIKPAVEKFKKELKLEKDSEGWFWFLGKNYKEVDAIPDEEFFEEAYKAMAEVEKKLYRSYKIKLPEAISVEETVAKLKGNPDVEYAEPNYLATIYYVPNDPYYSSSGTWGQTYDDLWGLKKIQTEQAWDISTGSNQVTVAVIDTGVDRNHEDIQENMWVNNAETPSNGLDDDGNGYIDDYYGWDWINNDNDPMDDQGHGTHVAGTIGAVGNNSIGVVGVNWNVKIMPLKFLGASGGGYSADAAEAIVYAADNGAKVLSNSWGFGSRFPSAPIIETAIDYAHSLGSTIVFAAGNRNDDVMYYSPANYPKVITVAATNYNDQKASFSNWGAKIDVAAPGVEILSLRAAGTDMYLGASGYNPGDRFVPPNDPAAQYYRANGTSMATPHVSGLAALVLSLHPDLVPEEVRQVIRQTSQNPGGEEWSSYFGYGIINAAQALAIPGPPPIARILSPSSGSIFIGNQPYTFTISGIAQTRSGVVSWELFEGVGESPTEWELKGSGTTTTVDVPITLSGDTRTLTYKLIVYDPTTGLEGEDRCIGVNLINVGPDSEVQAGWQLPSSSGSLGSSNYNIAIGDINGDEEFEIVCVPAITGRAYAWDINGNLLPGWPVDLNIGGGFTPMYPTSVQLADIDDDGAEEVVFAQEYENLITPPYFREGLWVLKGNGIPAVGWPKIFDWRTFASTPAVSDLDNDGTKEIIYYGLGWDVNLDVDPPIIQRIQEINVFSAQGEPRNSWPKRVNLASSRVTLPGFIVSDLDRDAEKEIVVAFDQLTTDGLHQIHAYSPEGELLPGWPKNFTPEDITKPQGLSVGDIDKDGLQEIVFVGYKISEDPYDFATYLTVMKGKEGRVMSGWPQILQDPLGHFYSISTKSPILADIDGDTSDEIVFTRKTLAFRVGIGLTALSLGGQIVLDTPSVPLPAGAELFLTAAGDLDADGIDELLTAAGGIFRAGERIWESPDFISQFKLIGDVDKDGKPELIGFGFDNRLLLILNYPGLSPANGHRAWPMSFHDTQRSSWTKQDLQGKNCPCQSFGDVDTGGLVTELDAQLVLRAEVGLVSLTPWQRSVADVNIDRNVDIVDALFILQYAIGTRDTFPVCDTTPPTGSILINNNAAYTNTTSVTLNLSAQDTGGSGLDQMMFSNDNLTWSTQEAYATTKKWSLTTGDGKKIVYAKFLDKAGNWSEVYADTIILDTTLPTITNISDSPDPFYTKRGQVSRISYTSGDNLSSSLYIYVHIYNSAGSWVRTLGRYTQALGNNSATWNGRNSWGLYVRNGTYKYRIKAQDLAGNYTYSGYYYVTKR